MEVIPNGKEKDYTDPAVQGLIYCNKLFEYKRSYREKGLSNKQNAPDGSRLARALPTLEISKAT